MMSMSKGKGKDDIIYPISNGPRSKNGISPTKNLVAIQVIADYNGEYSISGGFLWKRTRSHNGSQKPLKTEKKNLFQNTDSNRVLFLQIATKLRG